MDRSENIEYLTLIKKLSASGVLKSKRIVNAFLETDRLDFVVPEHMSRAYEDVELPTRAGQNTSQPKTVAFMLELLDVKLGDKVLDLGSGAGFTTALLANLVGPKGYVWGIDIMPELVELSQRNILKYNFQNVQILNAGKELGLPIHAPFDKILVNSYSNELSSELIAQLVVGGTLVMPVKNNIVKVEKLTETEYTLLEYKGYVFLPLVKVDKVQEKII